MDRDTGTTDGPLQQLAAGFSALSDEYKDLARRYQQLETKLTRAQEQVWLPGLLYLCFHYDETPLALDL